MKKIFFLFFFSFLFVQLNGSETDPALTDSKKAGTKIEISRPLTMNSFGDYDKYFSVGAGFGRSYGGIGAKLQWRRGTDFAWGPHFGLGYTPNSIGFPIFANIGCKMFFYKPFYVDLQFGVFGENSEYVNTGYDSYVDEWPAWGPSILGGVDLNIGNMFGINAGGGVSLDIGGSEIFPAFDVGVFIRF